MRETEAEVYVNGDNDGGGGGGGGGAAAAAGGNDSGDDDDEEERKLSTVQELPELTASPPMRQMRERNLGEPRRDSNQVMDFPRFHSHHSHGDPPMDPKATAMAFQKSVIMRLNRAQLAPLAHKHLVRKKFPFSLLSCESPRFRKLDLYLSLLCELWLNFMIARLTIFHLFSSQDFSLFACPERFPFWSL